MPDDYPATTDTTATVTVGGTATSEVETAHDRDWFAVELVAGTTYRFDLEGSKTGAGTLRDPWLRGIHDAQGRLVAGTSDDDGGEGWNARLEFTATETGTYYVAAGGHGGGTGSYRLGVAEARSPEGREEGAQEGAPVDDGHPADATTTATVEVGGTATGEVEAAHDRDWFAVELEAGVTYRFDLEGSETGAGTLRDPHLRGIHDSEGELIAGTTDDDGGHGWNSRLEFTATETGTHYVAAGANASGTGAYALSVSEVERREADPAADVPADATTAATVEVGGTATGEVEAAHDRDWLAVDLKAGVTYRFDLEGAATEAGTLADPHLHGVHGPSGKPVPGTEDDDGGEGLNARLEFTARETGTHHVVAGAGGSGTGAYTLSVSEAEGQGTDDVPADATTTATVAVGGSAAGEIGAAHDRDWYAVELEEGVTYRFDLEGSETGTGTLSDPYLRGVHDAQGDLIPGTTDDDGGAGFDAKLLFTATETGIYYVAAGAYGSGTGAYTLSVSEAGRPETGPAADVPAAATTAATVDVGGSATGEIGTAHDRDWYAVKLVAGSVYRIDLEGSETGAGTLADPFLRGVHDAQGRLIAGTADDDGGEGLNARLEFTAGETGIHYVAAGAHDGGTGAYALSVRELLGEGEIRAAVASAAPLEVGGLARARIDGAGDRDWFAVELVAGTVYRIGIEGSEAGGGTLLDPWLRGIHGPDGALLAGTADDDGAGLGGGVELAARETGTHHVVVGAGGDGTGAYTLSAVAVAGDVPAGIATPATVEVGGTATGEVEAAHDRDWYAVELEAGVAYRIDLEGSETGVGTLADPYLHGVHDAQGDLIPGTTDDDGGAGLDSRLEFTARETGMHYVAAGGHGPGAGAYRLTVAAAGEAGAEPLDQEVQEDAPDTRQAAQQRSGPPETKEEDNEDDEDTIVLAPPVVATGGAATQTMEQAQESVPDTTQAAQQQSGTPETDEEDTDTEDTVVLAPPLVESVPPLAEVDDGDGSPLVAEEQSSDDYPADTTTTATVAVGGTATGEIETADDRDWFAVEFTAGKHYRIDLEGESTGAGTLRKPYLAGIHDSEGNLIAGTEDTNSGEGRNARLLFTATETGTHYIAAGRWLFNPGTYRLSVTEIDAPDIPSSTATTATVAVGGSATGEIETQGDWDWFAVTLERGRVYQIDMKGQSTGDGTLRDPLLTAIYNSWGRLIHGDPDNNGGEGKNARLLFTARDSATHYVAVQAYDGGTGTYTLSVTDLGEAATEPPVDIPGTTATTATIEVDGFVVSDIWYHGDRDWFAVEFEAGETYRIDLKGGSTRDGTLVFPVLHGIRDSSGNPIAGTHDDNSGIGWNSVVVFTARETGTHYIVAGASLDKTGTYRLSVTAAGGAATETMAQTQESVPDTTQAAQQQSETPETDEEDTEDTVVLAPPLVESVPPLVEDDDGEGSPLVAEEQSSDDYPADTTTTATVAVGGTATGEIETSGDSDWFAVELVAGTTYRIDIEGFSDDAGTLLEPRLYGVYLEEDSPDTGLRSWMFVDISSGMDVQYFAATVTGTHYILAGSNGGNTGTYTLSVTEISDDHPSDTTTTATVAVGDTATGDVETPDDRDWFAVELTAGATYRIDLEGSETGAGTLADPYLHGIHDAQGDLIPGTVDDDGGEGSNSRLEFTATETGTHYVSAGGYGAGLVGTYSLEVAEVL